VEHLLDLEGRPTVMLVDMQGFGEGTETPSELLVQAGRADLIMWVASATQPDSCYAWTPYGYMWVCGSPYDY
jgi:hypothetical protein